MGIKKNQNQNRGIKVAIKLSNCMDIIFSREDKPTIMFVHTIL